MSATGWIQFGGPFRDLRVELNGDIVGTQVTVDNVDRLIGDMNVALGVCGCCSELDGDSIVTRYRRVWDGES